MNNKLVVSVFRVRKKFRSLAFPPLTVSQATLSPREKEREREREPAGTSSQYCITIPAHLHPVPFLPAISSRLQPPLCQGESLLKVPGGRKMEDDPRERDRK